MSDLKKYGIIEEEKRYCEESLYSMALIYNICNSRLSAFLKPYNLNPGKLNILVAIRFHGRKKGVSQIEISKHLIVSPSNMTKMIDKLQKEGMVRRESLPGDRRVNIIKVTPKAEKFLDQLWVKYRKMMESFMGDLPTRDKKQTAFYLKNWLRMLLKK